MTEHQPDHDHLHAAPTEKISVRAGEQAGRSDDPAATARLQSITPDAVATAPAVGPPGATVAPDAAIVPVAPGARTGHPSYPIDAARTHHSSDRRPAASDHRS